MSTATLTPLQVALIANGMVHLTQVLAFAYALSRWRERAMGMWLCGSFLLLIWIGAAAWFSGASSSAGGEILTLLLLVASVACVCDGTLRFAEAKLQWLAWSLSAAAGVWALCAHLGGLSLTAATTPAAIAVPLLVLRAGIGLWRSPHGQLPGARLASVSLILWGLHFADYPLLRGVEWFAPLGFLIAGLLSILIIAGVLLLRLELAAVRSAALERRLAQAHKLEAIGRVTGGIAHDFNNLLTVVLSATSLLRNRPDLSTGDARLLSQAGDAAEHAGQLAKQLLGISGRSPQPRHVIDIGARLARLKPLLDGLAGERITVTIDAIAHAGAVSLAPGQLEQIFSNLTVNAREAMPDGGTIEVRGRLLGDKSGRRVQLTFHDSGPGMPAEVADRIFEPFFTTKPGGTGTGLGLATVYRLVVQNGGEISLETGPGRGTTFTLTFPTVAAPPAPALEPAPALPRGEGTVLLVEDDPFVRAVAEQVLARHGYQVIGAGDGAAALALFSDHQPEIVAVVTDVAMPKLTGPELAEQLRRAWPAVPILFVSGAAGRLGAEDRLLAKPYTPEQLLRAVHELLAASDRHPALESGAGRMAP